MVAFTTTKRSLHGDENPMKSDDCKDLMLAVYASVLGRSSATYCSAPITSGLRYLEWLDRTGKRLASIDEADEAERAEHAREVVAPNQAHAREVVARLRKNQPHVIDPTSVPHVHGWTQIRWLAFWELVIAAFAAEAVFVDGWQYSNGCSYEFWIAKSRKLPTYDERRRPIDVEMGRSMIAAAVEAMKKRGASTSKLEEALRALAALAADAR